FESSENAISESENQSENDCHVVEKECDKVENSKVIAPGLFKLSVSQSVSSISMLKTSCDSKNVKNLDTFSSIRRPKNSGVIWKKKGSSNTSNVDLSDIVQICLWIIDSGCSKHMMGNRALLTNFVEKFLGTVRFGNNDFAVIAGYRDVVIGLPKMKFEKDHLCFACEQGKIHRKHHKSKMAFASNKPLYLLHMDLYAPMLIESINGKRYVLVVVDDYSRYTWVFFLHSKDEASDGIISFIKKTQMNLQLQVQRIRTDNGT
nr:retrotransposon protein, putative, unclassified [Tanacetum cinerariifolium]